MDRERLRALLTDLQSGEVTVGEAMEALRRLPFEDLGFAKVDTHRSIRKDLPEVVYCPGKTPDQVVAILERLSDGADQALATRASPEVGDAVLRAFGEGEVHQYPEAGLLLVGAPRPPKRGQVAVVTGGTSDRPVAEEAAVTAEVLGNRTTRIYDVGVAGVHRLLEHQDVLQEAQVVVVVAGMEGALPSVVAGLVAAPVVAVPTSVGYGASFDGLAALLGMLNSCVPGVVTVNVDNGFGAACFAHLVNGN